VISAPAGTPFTEKQYVIPDAVRADSLSAEAERELAVSQHASSVATKYVVVALVLALVFGLFGFVRMLTMRQLL
jgi:hypothetical protein